MSDLERLIITLQKALDVENKNTILNNRIRYLETQLNESVLLREIKKLKDENKGLRDGLNAAKAAKGEQKHIADCLRHENNRLKGLNTQLELTNAKLITQTENPQIN